MTIFYGLNNKNVEFVAKKVAKMDYFKILIKIGNLYQSNVIWASYLEYHKNNQIFLNNVKKYFELKNIDYDIHQTELEIYSQEKFTRTLEINPELLCKYNTNITASLLDNIMIGLNDYYLTLAKQTEDTASMEINYVKSGQRVMRVHFDQLSSLVQYEETIKTFTTYMDKIIPYLKVEKNKLPAVYTEEIEKLHLYFKMQNNFDNKPKGKTNKI